MSIRNWNAKGDPPSEEELQPFIHLLDKYVVHLQGRSTLDRYLKKNRNKTMIDKVTASDIAYTILTYENYMDVWQENRLKKESGALPKLYKYTNRIFLCICDQAQ